MKSTDQGRTQTWNSFGSFAGGKHLRTRPMVRAELEGKMDECTLMDGRRQCHGRTLPLSSPHPLKRLGRVGVRC